MKKLCLLLALTINYAHALEFNIKGINDSTQRTVVDKALSEVMEKLPQKFKEGLPASINVVFRKYRGASEVPSNLCGEKLDEKFTYGQYSHPIKTLMLNEVIIKELQRGRENAREILCQHKNTYDQVIATIIHELTHAYDLNQNISKTAEYLRVAGFKKSLFGKKTRNITPMRSSDDYEFKNILESFAVNLEYFIMDSEFACRRPVMFKYMKKHFNFDPHPNRNCEVNSTFMLSSALGFIPHKVDLNRVYRIDYLLAGKGDDMASGFGHSMFRIVMCAPDHVDPITQKFIKATPFGENCLEDKLFHLVISYRANAEGANLNYLKGIFGGYPSMLFILGFEDVLNEYNSVELRDVTSYPLKFSNTEKNEFMQNVLEEHWNYRGSYKFVTNNCAVESLKLVDEYVTTRDTQSKKSLTPYGILEEMVKSGLIDDKDKGIEVFKSKTDYLANAYVTAYEIKQKNLKSTEKALKKFIKNSTPTSRLEHFKNFHTSATGDLTTRQGLAELKQKYLKIASFSVIEKHAVRAKISEFQKKVAEYAMEHKDVEIKQLSLEELSQGGYGIPLDSEMITKEKLASDMAESEKKIAEAQELLKSVFPEDLKALDELVLNLEIINKASVDTRKKYKSNLDIYIEIQIAGMAKDDLIYALGSEEALLNIRKLLGEDLATTTEISDQKLIKIIQSKH